MAKIRSFGNRTTELRFVVLLREARIRSWRRHLALPGRPDFTFQSKKVAVFVDGCFWHGCPRCFKLPKNRRDFWAKKIEYNKLRDKKNLALLKSKDFLVLRVWEHEIKYPDTADLVIKKLAMLLEQRTSK